MNFLFCFKITCHTCQDSEVEESWQFVNGGPVVVGDFPAAVSRVPRKQAKVSDISISAVVSCLVQSFLIANNFEVSVLHKL